ncbi:MAG: hypothetical protein HQK78_08635, partial [Desulfobacterales bacterium]|nr:hypothetical protein [Desulfobacterales bacterium]
GIAALQTSAQFGTNSANDITGATSAAMDRVEQLEAIAYANLANGGPQQVTVNNRTFNVTWVVQNNIPVTNVTTIDVTVAWSVTQSGVTRNKQTVFRFVRASVF